MDSPVPQGLCGHWVGEWAGALPPRGDENLGPLLGLLQNLGWIGDRSVLQCGKRVDEAAVCSVYLGGIEQLLSVLLAAPLLVL